MTLPGPGPAPDATDVLLAQRLAAIDQAIPQAEGLLAPDNAAQARKAELITDLKRNREAVQEEIGLRDEWRRLEAERAAEPEPDRYRHPWDHHSWWGRERLRRDRQAQILKRLSELEDPTRNLGGLTDLSETWLRCLKDQLLPIPVKPVNRLVRVEFLNGFNPADASGKSDPILDHVGNQWVNLLEERTRIGRGALPPWLRSFAGQAVETVDRLSHVVRVRVEFEHPGREHFLVKLVPTNAHAAYTKEERDHGPFYTPTPANPAGEAYYLDGTTDADGKAVVELFLTVAGGDRWQVTGEDDYRNSCTSTGQVFTRRGLFVATLTMEHMSPVSLAPVQAEYKRHEIWLEIAELRYPAAMGPVPHKAMVHRDGREVYEGRHLEAQLRERYDAGTLIGAKPAQLEPHLLTVLFCDMIPAPAADHFNSAVLPPAASYTLASPQPFWDPHDDNAGDHPWLRKVTATIFRDISLPPTETEIPVDQITPLGDALNGYRGLRLKLPPETLAEAKQIYFRVDYTGLASGALGGTPGAQRGTSFILMARRSSYKDLSPESIALTLTHEIGHQLNFVPGPEPSDAPVRSGGQAAPYSPAYRWLAPSPTFYYARTHTGGHCFHGAVRRQGGSPVTGLVADFGGYQGGCVMFGSASSPNGVRFCPNCTERLRKLDLTDGWTAP